MLYACGCGNESVGVKEIRDKVGPQNDGKGKGVHVCSCRKDGLFRDPQRFGIAIYLLVATVSLDSVVETIYVSELFP